MVVITMVILTLLVIISLHYLRVGFQMWRTHEREKDVHRLQLLYCTMNDGGLHRKKRKFRFGKTKE